MDIKATKGNFDYVTQELRKVDFSKAKRIRVTDWSEKRGLSANAQQHFWYKQIADHYGDRLWLDVKATCKDMFGLPIILQSEVHADKMEFLLHKLNYYNHSYESRMKLIHCLEVTSLFNTSESKEYMDNMIYYFNDLGVNIKYKDK